MGKPTPGPSPGTSQRDDPGHIVWSGEALRLLDQRLLPGRCEYLECRSAEQVAQAIADMVVRGAPAIGIAAAYGAVLSARRHLAGGARDWRTPFEADLDRLGRARPTAVNLAWALARMRAVAHGGPGDARARLEAEARRIHAEDVQANLRMGELGAALLPERGAVLTHCNAGSLATGGYGTALGVIRSGVRSGRVARVYAGETRPWLQGSRLTAWELARDGIEVTLLGEGAAGALMRQGALGWVIVGADRVAANGDVANKIGTYNLAVLARQHGVRMMVVAPTSTIDRSIASGADIVIEERAGAELLDAAGYGESPAGVRAWNPVFDVTPAALVDALVTERGVAAPPDPESISALFE